MSRNKYLFNITAALSLFISATVKATMVETILPPDRNISTKPVRDLVERINSGESCIELDRDGAIVALAAAAHLQQYPHGTLAGSQASCPPIMHSRYEFLASSTSRDRLHVPSAEYIVGMLKDLSYGRYMVLLSGFPHHLNAHFNLRNPRIVAVITPATIFPGERANMLFFPISSDFDLNREGDFASKHIPVFASIVCLGLEFSRWRPKMSPDPLSDVASATAIRVFSGDTGLSPFSWLAAIVCHAPYYPLRPKRRLWMLRRMLRGVRISHMDEGGATLYGSGDDLALAPVALTQFRENLLKLQQHSLKCRKGNCLKLYLQNIPSGISWDGVGAVADSLAGISPPAWQLVWRFDGLNALTLLTSLEHLAAVIESGVTAKSDRLDLDLRDFLLKVPQHKYYIDIDENIQKYIRKFVRIIPTTCRKPAQFTRIIGGREVTTFATGPLVRESAKIHYPDQALEVTRFIKDYNRKMLRYLFVLRWFLAVAHPCLIICDNVWDKYSLKLITDCERYSYPLESPHIGFLKNCVFIINTIKPGLEHLIYKRPPFHHVTPPAASDADFMTAQKAKFLLRCVNLTREQTRAESLATLGMSDDQFRQLMDLIPPTPTDICLIAMFFNQESTTPEHLRAKVQRYINCLSVDAADDEGLWDIISSAEAMASLPLHLRIGHSSSRYHYLSQLLATITRDWAREAHFEREGLTEYGVNCEGKKIMISLLCLPKDFSAFINTDFIKLIREFSEYLAQHHLVSFIDRHDVKWHDYFYYILRHRVQELIIKYRVQEKRPSLELLEKPACELLILVKELLKRIDEVTGKDSLFHKKLSPQQKDFLINRLGEICLFSGCLEIPADFPFRPSELLTRVLSRIQVNYNRITYPGNAWAENLIMTYPDYLWGREHSAVAMEASPIRGAIANAVKLVLISPTLPAPRQEQLRAYWDYILQYCDEKASSSIVMYPLPAQV